MILQSLDRLFTHKEGWEEGAQFDMLATQEKSDNTLLSIINPVNFAPELRYTQHRANALKIAKQLLGSNAEPAFEHCILKPAHYGSPTPWHQDEAYRSSDNFHYNQISIWMPLQDATIENGCMQYIPHSHKQGIYKHRPFGDDEKSHSIECIDPAFDASKGVWCPLKAGEVSIHQGRTLHRAGNNTTSLPRYAYILAFETTPVASEKKQNFYWNYNRQSPELIRRKSWMKKGGAFIYVMRKIRYSNILYSPRCFAFEVKRLFHVFFSKQS